MILDEQTQQIVDHILAAALQAETAEAGLNQIYDVIIAWAEQVSLDAVFAYNETRFDQQRLDQQWDEEARRKIPARAYLRLWSVAKLREEPVHALNQRLMEKEYQPERVPFPASSTPSLSEAEISAYGRALGGSLSIEQALDHFEALVVQYASLVEPKKVRQALAADRQPGSWTEEDAFQAVFTLLYYSFVDPISAHGLWQTGSAQPGKTWEPGDKAPGDKAPPVPGPFFESDPPEVVFLRALSPEVMRAYQEAAYALIHYRVAHQHSLYETVGSGLPVPELSRLLNDFETLSLTGESGHWAQPVPGLWPSLRATSFLLLAGTAAPAVLIQANIDPLTDTSATGQAIRRMLTEYRSSPDEPGDEPIIDIIQLYQAAEKEVRARWLSLERVAKRLLAVGALPKAEAYQLLMEG